ncbi:MULTISPECIES: hypothetical protein [Pseudomonas]|jgi:hypothetical protein|uniref:Fimbrial protein n=1 Tax=Pseudomonas fluorescens TaxID=294 RepID=A0A125QDH6_PSEFL|nr:MULTISPECIES: hypothetical protein [Pseudomonas]KAA6194028.1 hypothetical protein F3K52_17335 [Pseudomonas lactis]KRC91474.1 hypothetical protein ASE33_09550 [Pseudomonas sp. Root9]KWV71934.1 hypothetical protein PFL603g_04475 [Pseudomonas fluorescens]
MQLITATKKWLGPWALALGVGWVSLPVQALEQNISAVFRPDPTNPMVNKFQNTTPHSGICAWHVPALCESLNTFSIRTDELMFNSIAQIEAGHEDPRKGAYYKVPSSWRDVQVTHVATGQVETVQMRIAGIGGRWGLGGGARVTVWSAPGRHWADPWRYGVDSCRGVNYYTSSGTYLLYFWIVPENGGACSVVPSAPIPQMWYQPVEYGYELRTPNPLGMASGEYRGSLSYSIGPGRDFDFGDVMMPNDNTLTFNFDLRVDHILKVELPPGGNRVELLPEGGWQAWLNRGRQPSRLFRDQTFTIYSSGHFKMQLECGLVIGNTCGLRNGGGDEVPLQVSVTLPFGLQDQYGQAVNKLPLRLDGSGTELFQSTHYVSNRPGSLHFAVERDDVKEMLKQPGSTYTGVVTVIWDSEV